MFSHPESSPPLSKYVGSARSKCSSLTVTESKGVLDCSRRLRKYVDPVHSGNTKINASHAKMDGQGEGHGSITNAQMAGNHWSHGQMVPYRHIALRTHRTATKQHASAQGALGGAFCKLSERLGAAALQGRIREQAGTNSPNGTIHSILRDEKARGPPRKGWEAKVGPLRAQALRPHMEYGLEAGPRRDVRQSVGPLLDNKT